MNLFSQEHLAYPSFHRYRPQSVHSFFPPRPPSYQFPSRTAMPSSSTSLYLHS